ncbi:MAG: DVU_1557 family redox protein [Desulfovibrionaceae bacterium]
MDLIKLPESETAGWVCETCHEPLVPAPTELDYLNSRFNVVLPRCPKCGFVLVPESLALHKMAEVERLLEDK